MPNTPQIDDRLIYTAQRSWWPSSPLLITGLAGLGLGGFLSLLTASHVLLFISLAFAAFFFLKGAAIKYRTRAKITTHRIVIHHSLIGMHSTTVNLNRIESLDIDQNFIQQLLGYGNITLRGVGSEDVYLQGIANPELFKRSALVALDNL